MNRSLLFLAVILALALVPSLAHAQRIAPAPESGTPSQFGTRVVAVVNDNVISTFDLESRIKLATISSGLPNTEEVQRRLLPQVLRSLIDEQLQLQEAKRLDINITKEDVDQAFQRIAHDNNIPDMRAYIAAQGGSPEALASQIRGNLAWNKIIQRSVRPRVEVGDDEVEAAIERIRANAGKGEFLVSEIFLGIDNPTDEEEVKQFAENLVQQLKGGANFGAVARQFSQGTGAATGGDIGWIQEGQLAPELNRALESMQPGEVVGPIRSSSGYHILGVREKRTIAASDPGEVSLDLQQAFRSFDDTTTEAVAQESGQLRSTISSCTNLQEQLASRFPAWRWQDLGETKMSKMPSWVADKVSDLSIGKPSEPLATDKGALVFFVCDRHVPEGGINREAIFNSIGTEKMELQARRLLRDLRRTAYVDIRLGQKS
ncbi:MAG: peptidylprolyl isomerase [Alphaproteobacteria bacterium]|nr:peptidylprolyl isomerase [Alphaproteobacteria bacterium]